MAWVRLDDGFITHPKALAVGPLGRELFISGLCWCATHLTDGQIPKVVVPVLAAQAGVKPALTKTLVAAGLWHDEGDHYRVHDFLDYNESAYELRQRRAARAEAGRRGGLRSGESRNGSKHEASASPPLQANAEVVATPTLQPRPGPARPLGISLSAAAAARCCDDRPAAAAAMDLIVKIRRSKEGDRVRNVKRWTESVRAGIVEEYGEQIKTYLDQHPDAAASDIVIAGCGFSEFDIPWGETA
jgi:hypothetical protein